MRLRVAPTSDVFGHRWARRLSRMLTLAASLALVAALVPVHSRDLATRGSRSAAARASTGSQRWDVHHDGCELPLHVTESDSLAESVRTRVSVTSSPGDDDVLQNTAAEDSLTVFDDAGPVLALDDENFAGGASPPRQSRAPPYWI